MARKQKHEEHENHERWLVSYADFITLLFAFFVVMYSISSVNEGKYRVLSDSMMAAFRSQPKTLLPIQEGQPAKSAKFQEDPIVAQKTPAIVAPSDLPTPDMARRKRVHGGPPVASGEIADQLEQALDRLIDEDLIAVRYNDDYVEIEIKDSVLFPTGSTQLTLSAKEILTRTGKILKNFPNVLRVEGYSDGSKFNSTIYPSNWELSSARAGSVVRALAEAGVVPPRMSAVGYAQYRPVADDATPEGRNQNRRVTIVVLNSTDTYELREDLYLASTSKDGKPPRKDAGEANGGLPQDVTTNPVTEASRFVVIEHPIGLSPPINLIIAPPARRAEQVPRQMPNTTGSEVHKP